MIRRAGLICALVLVTASGVTSAAPGGLVIDGTEIVDSATYAAAKQEGKLLLYSTFESRIMGLVVGKFQSDTGLSVDVIRLPTAEMFGRATSEFSAHRLAADYVDTSDVTLTQQLADRGILRGYKVPGFNGFDPALRDPDGRWYSTIRSIIAIGINSALVKPADEPSKWSDVLDPRWKEKIGFANVDAGGTSYSFWFFIRQRFGLDAWRKAAAQNPRIGYSAQPVLTDLARGETVIAVDPIESFIGGIAAGSPIKIILPPGGPSYGLLGGITTVATHPHAAEVWMNWITSKHAAGALAALGLYSIRRDAPIPQVPSVSMPASDTLYNVRASDYLRTHAAYVKEWHDIFVTH